MKDLFKIFLSGGIGGMDKKEYQKWRNDFCNLMVWENSDIYSTIQCFDPSARYSYTDSEHDTEEEVINYNLWNLKNSDIVVVYFNKPNSIGTATEIALAKYAWHIPVYGILKEGQTKEDLDFTVRNCVDKYFKSDKDCVEYIKYFYLF